MKSVFAVIFLMLAGRVAGQSTPEIVIPAGAIVAEVLTPDKIYQHPQFVAGKVLYRNGTETEALLNYNNLRGAIEFIGPGNDTLVIDKDLLLTIRKIIISGHTYLYQQGYFEQVAENAYGKLLKRQIYQVTDREKMGAFSQFSALSAISSFSNLTDRTGGVSRSLTVNEKITLTLRTAYFFGDKNDHMLPASKKNLIKSYPLRKLQIEEYLNRQAVDFTNLQSLQGLFAVL